jgi:serine protease Do
MKSYSDNRLASRLIASGLLLIQSTIGTVVAQEMLKDTSAFKLAYAAQASTPKANAADVYRLVQPSVVYISAETSEGTAQGSGVILSADGLIITNAHVIEDAEKITVELNDRRKVEAEVVSVGHSDCTDLALLRLPNQTNLPTIALGNPSSSQHGQSVFAIGYPEGIKPASITEGLISNIDNQKGLLQTSAVINGGNSGGALVNSRGELLGINTFTLRDTEAMAFAIDTNSVNAFVRSAQNKLSPNLGQMIQSQSGVATTLMRNGVAIEGRLQQDDAMFCADESVADVYTFQTQADQSVILEMSSDTIQPYMMLLGPDGKVVAKSGKSQDKQTKLYGKLSKAGTYTVIANSQVAKQFGRYAVRAVTPTLLRQSELSVGDSQTYSFSATANQRVAIEVMTEGDFRPFIQIIDSAKRVMWEGQWQDTIALTLPQSGAYQLMVSTANLQSGGSFTAVISPQATEAMVAQH